MTGGWWCIGWYGGRDIPSGGSPSGFPMQGLPSFTSTGTATRLGEFKPPTFKSWAPFSWTARFVLYLWFWNQIFTCVGVKRIKLARCSLSGADKYRCCLNRLSNSYVCALENKTRRLRFLWETELGGWSWSLSSSCSKLWSWSRSWSWSCSWRPSVTAGDTAAGPTYDNSDARDVLSGLACWPITPITTIIVLDFYTLKNTY